MVTYQPYYPAKDRLVAVPPPSPTRAEVRALRRLRRRWRPLGDRFTPQELARLDYCRWLWLTHRAWDVVADGHAPIPAERALVVRS
jgi:hypothetical protein